MKPSNQCTVVEPPTETRDTKGYKLVGVRFSGDESVHWVRCDVDAPLKPGDAVTVQQSSDGTYWAAASTQSKKAKQEQDP